MINQKILFTAIQMFLLVTLACILLQDYEKTLNKDNDSFDKCLPLFVTSFVIINYSLIFYYWCIVITPWQWLKQLLGSGLVYILLLPGIGLLIKYFVSIILNQKEKKKIKDRFKYGKDKILFTKVTTLTTLLTIILVSYYISDYTITYFVMSIVVGKYCYFDTKIILPPKDKIIAIFLENVIIVFTGVFVLAMIFAPYVLVEHTKNLNIAISSFIGGVIGILISILGLKLVIRGHSKFNKKGKLKSVSQ